MPWLACLYVSPRYRGQRRAERLLSRALSEAKRLRFNNLYLSTNLEKFYERKGWKLLGIGYNIFDEDLKIYHYTVNL